MSSSTNFFSRGSISFPNARFHMVGVIEAGTESSVLPEFLQGIPTTSGKTTRDFYFILCMNNFLDSSGNKKERLFWSTDPTDFIMNFNSNSQNQGPVHMEFFGKKGNNNYGINFFSSKKNNIYTHVPSFSNQLTSNPDDIQKNNSNGARFDINMANDEYNLTTNSVFVSIPYELIPSFQSNSVNTDRQYRWCFRKIYSSEKTQNNIVIDANTSYNSTKLFDYTPPSGGNPLNNTNVPKIDFGTTHFNITHTVKTLNGVTQKYFSIPNSEWNSASNKGKFQLINKKNGIIKFLENTNVSNFMYLKYSSVSYDSNENILFNYVLDSDITMYGKTNIISIGSFLSCQIEYEIRNHPFGFESVLEVESGANKLSSWFKIYFIPTVKFGIFSGGFTLEKSEILQLKNLAPDSTSGFIIYNPNTGANTTGSNILDKDSFQNYFYRELSTFFILNLLGGLPSFWTPNSEPNYPNVAINPTLNGNTSCTIFTWTTQTEAHHDFMYSYCTSSEICGYCYGNGQKTSTCVPHNNSKKNAALVGLGDTEQPVFLTSDRQSALVKQIESKENTSLWVLIGMFSLLFLIIIITVLVIRFYNSQEETNNIKQAKCKTITTTKKSDSKSTSETKVKPQ